MHHPTDMIAHTTAFGTPVVEHWLEREIAQWVHHGGSIGGGGGVWRGEGQYYVTEDHQLTSSTLWGGGVGVGGVGRWSLGSILFPPFAGIIQ